MKSIYFFILIILIASCKGISNHYNQNNIYERIVESFVEYRNKEIEVDKTKNILIIGVNSLEKSNGDYSIDICFVNPKLLQDFQYSKVYKLKGYKLIIDESSEESVRLKNQFKTTKYEDFNLATTLIDYDSKNWFITFNSKNEITRVSPAIHSKYIKELLSEKRLKFANDFDENYH